MIIISVAGTGYVGLVAGVCYVDSTENPEILNDVTVVIGEMCNVEIIQLMYLS